MSEGIDLPPYPRGWFAVESSDALAPGEDLRAVRCAQHDADAGRTGIAAAGTVAADVHGAAGDVSHHPFCDSERGDWVYVQGRPCFSVR